MSAKQNQTNTWHRVGVYLESMATRRHRWHPGNIRIGLCFTLAQTVATDFVVSAVLQVSILQVRQGYIKRKKHFLAETSECLA